MTILSYSHDHQSIHLRFSSWTLQECGCLLNDAAADGFEMCELKVIIIIAVDSACLKCITNSLGPQLRCQYSYLSLCHRARS